LSPIRPVTPFMMMPIVFPPMSIPWSPLCVVW
jgi:hypothetical protein